MAAAALEVLGITAQVAAATPVDLMAVEVMVPQVGQGAVAVECASEAATTRALLAEIDHLPTRWAVECERAFLAELGSGCSLPVGAHAVVDAAGSVCLRAFLSGPGGVYEGVHEGPLDETSRWAAEAARLASQAVGA